MIGFRIKSRDLEIPPTKELNDPTQKGDLPLPYRAC